MCIIVETLYYTHQLRCLYTENVIFVLASLMLVISPLIAITHNRLRQTHSFLVTCVSHGVSHACVARLVACALTPIYRCRRRLRVTICSTPVFPTAMLFVRMPLDPPLDPTRRHIRKTCTSCTIRSAV